MEINNKMIKKLNYWMIKIISKKHKMINSCNIWMIKIIKIFNKMIKKYNHKIIKIMKIKMNKYWIFNLKNNSILTKMFKNHYNKSQINKKIGLKYKIIIVKTLKLTLIKRIKSISI